MIEWMKPCHTHFVRLVEPDTDFSVPDIVPISDTISVIKYGAGGIEPLFDGDGISATDQVHVIRI
jgi:hypothetical protein